LFYDGSEFIGMYSDGKKNGKGKYSWSDSSVYDGEFKNNVFEGFL